jgi:hypothetical protein
VYDVGRNSSKISDMLEVRCHTPDTQIEEIRRHEGLRGNIDAELKIKTEEHIPNITVPLNTLVKRILSAFWIVSQK